MPVAEGRLLDDYPISFVEVLKQQGFSPQVRGPWAFVGETSRVQGWKLHLSSIPLDAVALLRAVSPHLRAAAVTFKVAKDEAVLEQLNEGGLGQTQTGKFVTIYPESDQECRRLAEECASVTGGLRGPTVRTDLRFGSVVYTRYGGFNPIITHDRLGRRGLSIWAPDGSLRTDSYRIPFVPPDDVPNPFCGLRERDAAGLLGADVASRRGTRLIGPGYLFVEVLQSDATGAVFLAMDLRNQASTSLKVIKQGRQHCLSDRLGRDIRTRLQRQEMLHNALSSQLAVPAADPYFELEGDGYLPLAHIGGANIDSITSRFLRDLVLWPVSSRTYSFRRLQQRRRSLGVVGARVVDRSV